jgi:hypothetical protein
MTTWCSWGDSKRGLLRRSLLAATLGVFVGCSSNGVETFGSTEQAAYANEKTVYDYFVGKGLTNFQAAGVVGNLIQESGLDPTIHQYNNGPGRGLAQWSAGARWDTTQGDNVKDYAAQHGSQDVYSLALQLDFIWYELTTFDNYGLADLKASKTIESATQAFEDKFEGCVYANYPVCALPQRVTNAKAILAAYGSSGGTGGAGGGGGSGGTGGAAGAGGSVTTGGTSGGGVSPGGANGAGGSATTGGAAGTSTVGNAGAPPNGGGNTTSGGTGPNVAGSTTVAGGSNVAGSPGAAGTGFTNPGNSPANDSGCSFSMRRPRSGPLSALPFALAVASALRHSRRRSRRSARLLART